MSRRIGFRNHRHYSYELTSSSEKISDEAYRAFSMADTTTLSSSGQIKMIIKALDHIIGLNFNGPLGLESSTILEGVVDALDGIAEDLHEAKCAIEAGVSKIERGE